MNKDVINSQLKRKLLDGRKFDSMVEKPNNSNDFLGSGNTFFTVAMIKRMIQTYYTQVEALSKVLTNTDLSTLCANIHYFLFNYIQYEIDQSTQQLRSPANSWQNRELGIDCKSYSIFAGSILSCLGIKFYIRQIKQAKFNPKSYSHVYIIVPINQETGSLLDGHYTIDGTLPTTKECNYSQAKDLYMDLKHVGLNCAAKKRPATKKVIRRKKASASLNKPAPASKKMLFFR